MSTDNNPKAQFQVNHGAGWQTIAEVDIINGIVNPPNAWTMVRALQKQIVYVGCTPIEIAIIPEGRAHTPEQKRAIIERLYTAWLQTPEQRLGQLLNNVFYQMDTFYIEDQALIEAIEKWTNR